MFDSPVVSVHIPPPWRNLTGGHNEITASGDTVGEVLEALGHEYPRVRNRLIADDGKLAAGVIVYLGGSSVGELQGLATAIEQAEVLSIIASA